MGEIFGDNYNTLVVNPEVENLLAEVNESAETEEVKSAYTPIIDSWKMSSGSGSSGAFAYTLGNRLYYVPDGTTNESGTFEDAIIKIRFKTKFTSTRGHFGFVPTAAKYILDSNAKYQQNLNTLNTVLFDDQKISSGNVPVDADTYTSVNEDFEDLTAAVTPDGDEELHQDISITDSHSGNSSADEDHDSQADDWESDFTAGAVETANFHGFVVANRTTRVDKRPVVNSPTTKGEMPDGTTTAKSIEVGNLEFYPYYMMTNQEGNDVPILSPKSITVPMSSVWEV